MRGYDGLVVVGESNPYGGDAAFALYHLPRGASGDRLREHLGMTDAAYERLSKVNLCEGEWCEARARARARDIREQYPLVVACGRKVARAFRDGAETPMFLAHAIPGGTMLTLPHPSGRNRTWNEPGARFRARVLLRTHAPGVPWGR